MIAFTLPLSLSLFAILLLPLFALLVIIWTLLTHAREVDQREERIREILDRELHPEDYLPPIQ